MPIVSNTIHRFTFLLGLHFLIICFSLLILLTFDHISLHQVKVKRRGDDRKYVAKVCFSPVIITSAFN